MTPEGRVKAKVNKALAALAWTYRFMPVQNGMGAPGLDYYCCIAGRFVAIETKVEGKTLTDRQRTTRDAIEAAGGLVFEIHNEGEITEMVAHLNLMMNCDARCRKPKEPVAVRPLLAGRADNVPERPAVTGR